MLFGKKWLKLTPEEKTVVLKLIIGEIAHASIGKYVRVMKDCIPLLKRYCSCKTVEKPPDHQRHHEMIDEGRT